MKREARRKSDRTAAHAGRFAACGLSLRCLIVLLPGREFWLFRYPWWTDVVHGLLASTPMSARVTAQFSQSASTRRTSFSGAGVDGVEG
jgi:hypothetical protein